MGLGTCACGVRGRVRVKRGETVKASGSHGSAVACTRVSWQSKSDNGVGDGAAERARDSRQWADGTVTLCVVSGMGYWTLQALICANGHWLAHATRGAVEDGISEQAG